MYKFTEFLICFLPTINLKITLRGDYMSKCSLIVGMVAGAALGLGAGMLIRPMDEADKKRLKKNTMRVFTSIGAVADQMISMYRD